MEVREAFVRFDKQEKGFLTPFETKCAVLACTGVKPRKREILKRFPESHIDMEGLSEIVAATSLPPLSVLENVFKAVFCDGQNSCSIDRFRQVAAHYRIPQAAEIFVSIDSDRDGLIQIDDLANFLNLIQ